VYRVAPWCDEAHEPVLLLRRRTSCMRRLGPSHRNVQLPSGVATFAGIRPLLTLPGVDLDPTAVKLAAAAHGIPLTTVELAADDIESTPRELHDRWSADLLIRPGQHVAWRGCAADEAAVALTRAAGW